MLTWEHKKFLKPWLDRAADDGAYFLYIEDDIAITDENVHYLIETRKRLAPRQLIPGLLRYETIGSEKYLVDVMYPEFFHLERSIKIGRDLYHSNINPYWAGMFLDRTLALEYVNSRSFSPSGSEFVRWDIRARAAMGR